MTMLSYLIFPFCVSRLLPGQAKKRESSWEAHDMGKSENGRQEHPIFTELGGGAWQVLPGLRASMWRIIADPRPGGHGVGISEVTFFRDYDLHSELHSLRSCYVMFCCTFFGIVFLGGLACPTNSHLLYMPLLETSRILFLARDEFETFVVCTVVHRPFYLCDV